MQLTALLDALKTTVVRAPSCAMRAPRTAVRAPEAAREMRAWVLGVVVGVIAMAIL
jgi:hypothetical protein